MAKVLLLPLLLLPSGHHQVADAISRWLLLHNSNIEIEKLEILSHFNRLLEKMVSQTYLKWIHHFPQTYAWMYEQLAYRNTKAHRGPNKGYEWLFLRTMREMIEKSKPDIIVCTHALPSFLCSRLKALGELTIPVVNVYTDYFMNNVWGRVGVDLHFAPTKQVKQQLVQCGVNDSQIFVTGIPVDYVFHQQPKQEKKQREMHILLAGGSIGIGLAQTFLERIIQEDSIQFTVLCGKNKALYSHVQSLDKSHIRAIGYIQEREEMVQLYDQMDAIVTKPGGVTTSEALHRGLPIFIHSCLPGQEEINREYLFQHRIAQPVDFHQSLYEQFHEQLAIQTRKDKIVQQMEAYRQELEWNDGLQKLINLL